MIDGRARTAFVRSARMRLLAVLPLLLLLLAGCVRIDPAMRDTCLAALPALAGKARPVTVEAIDTIGGRGETIRLVWSAGIVGAPRELACAFGEEAPGDGDRTLVGVRVDGVDLSLPRLFALRRWWLAVPDLRARALAEVRIAETARPRGLVTLGAAAGLRLQQTLDALAPAALYALLGLSAALILGLVGRLLVFVGDLAMLGAFAALTAAVAVVGTEAAAPLLAVPVTLLAAATVVGLWGREIGRVVVAPLAFRSPTPILVAAVGLSIALQEFVARAHGVRDVWLPPPAGRPILVADGPFEVFVTPMRLVLVVACGLAVVAVVVGLPRTRLGRAWRAVADDADMARLLGIDPATVIGRSCLLAGALAGVAGAVHMLAWGGGSFHMGTALGVKAVIAAVAGGIGSLPGAALAGFLLGLFEAGWTAAFGADWRDAAVFALLVALLIGRRDGLLGLSNA